jgi:hypothetical protein
MSNDTPFVIKDVLQGDDTSKTINLLEGIPSGEIVDSFRNLINSSNLSPAQRLELMSNTWKLNYRTKPPTIEEFLTEEWIGTQAKSIHPHVKDWLLKFWHPTSPYRNLILGTAIGTGKTTASTVSTLYLYSHLWAMRNPKKFFGLAESTSIVYMLISFSLEKAGQLLLQPFMNILEESPKFERVKQEERLPKRQLDHPDRIIWTTAGRMGSVQFSNELHLALASSPQKLLGLNLIGATLSEISFFVDQGFSPEYIWRIYQDAKNRVKNRFEGRYYSCTILDSSPNDMDLSPIDKYIFGGDAYKDPTNLVATGTHWDFLPKKHKEWYRTGETFPVFRGNSSEPPRMLRSDTEVAQYDAVEVYNVPIDLKIAFEENVVKNVKDWCGWPGGSSDKLIRDMAVIETMFSSKLRNLYTYILAPSDKSSEKLIWNQIRDKFFVPLSNGKYEFYRAPGERRYIHVDQAETGDTLGFSMVHPEITASGEFVFVTDFTIAIIPGKGRINLSAIPEFILDLKHQGGVNIDLITFDQYQSKATMQLLKEKGFRVELLSVDRDINVYLVYLSLINNGRVLAGRNIILKNNLKSLQETKGEFDGTRRSGKRKIDHRIGKLVWEDGANWESSLMGTCAKDLSDSHCGATWNCLHNFGERARYMWIPDKIVSADAPTIIHSRTMQTELLMQEVSNTLLTKYGLKIRS